MIYVQDGVVYVDDDSVQVVWLRRVGIDRCGARTRYENIFEPGVKLVTAEIHVERMCRLPSRIATIIVMPIVKYIGMIKQM